MLGHHRYACETAFRWRADDGPIIVSLNPSSPHQLKHVVSWPLCPLTKFSGRVHVRHINTTLGAV